MLYPDGTTVNVGDLIWWDEGHCVGFVQEVIETEADQRNWGLTYPHILIGGHPYKSTATGFVVYAGSDFDDEGIGRLTDGDSVRLDAAIQLAQAEARFDLSVIGFVVQTEVRDGIDTAWLIRANSQDTRSDTIRIPVDVVNGT